MSRSRRPFSPADRVLIAAASWLGPVVIRLLGATWRITEVGYERVEELHLEGRPAVFAFWHGVLLPLEYACRGRAIQVLSSLHRDGEISARLMTALGYGVVRGSSTRGSARGLMRMVSKAVEGFDLAVTPDGPRGPAGDVKRGIFYLAERSGGALVPVGVALTRARRLASWDSFAIPLPFSRVVIFYGEPLEWDEASPFEEKARLLKAALARAARGAERALSRPQRGRFS